LAVMLANWVLLGMEENCTSTSVVAVPGKFSGPSK